MTDSERPFDPSMPSGQFQAPPNPHQGTGTWDTQYGQNRYGQPPPDLPPSPYQSGQMPPFEPQQTGPYAVQPQPGPYGQQAPYGAPPQQFSMTSPPADKSVGVSVVLTFLFGGLGLFYSSIVGGIVMTLIEVIAVIVTILTFGLGVVLFVVIWPATMIWGAVSASSKHRDFEMWRMRQMQLAMNPYQPR